VREVPAVLVQLACFPADECCRQHS
jgi:hypothetical protein